MLLYVIMSVYKNVPVKRDLHKKLKVYAYEHELSIIKLIKMLIEKELEIKDGENTEQE